MCWNLFASYAGIVNPSRIEGQEESEIASERKRAAPKSGPTDEAKSSPDVSFQQLTAEHEAVLIVIKTNNVLPIGGDLPWAGYGRARVADRNVGILI